MDSQGNTLDQSRSSGIWGLFYGAEILATTLGLLMVATMALTIVRAYLPVPLFDQWVELTAADHWSHLFRPHNEHVITVPRLFFLVDKAVFGGTNIFNEAVSFLIQIANAALLFVLARRIEFPKRLAIGVILSALFWAYQYENFIVGFQLQFFSVFAAASAAVIVLALWREKGVVVALLLGLVASLCMANGMLIGIILVLLGIALRLSRKSLILLAVGAVAMVLTLLVPSAIYASVSSGSQHGLHAIGEAISNPLDVLIFFMAYFGAPFARLVFQGDIKTHTSLGFAALVGFAGIGMFVWSVHRMIGQWQQRLPLAAAPAAFAAIILFVSLTAAVTALGRAGSFPLAEVGSGRYGTPAMLFWTCMFALIWQEARNRSSLTLQRLVIGSSIVFCLILAASQPLLMKMILVSPPGFVEKPGEESHAAAYRLGDRSIGLSAVLSGVYDQPVLDSLYSPEEHLPANKIVELRASEMAPFNVQWSRWLGTPLRAHVTAVDYCTGEIDAAQPIGRAAFRIAGHMASGVAPKVIFLVSKTGTIIGFGRRDPGRSLLEAISDTNSGWHGYAKAMAGDRVTAYTIDSSSTACAIGVIALPS